MDGQQGRPADRCADPLTEIAIQRQDFSVADVCARLQALQPTPGAVVTFAGLVRDFAAEQPVRGLFVEHYPGMTEASIDAVARQACERWPLRGLVLVHRIGELLAGEQIVLVATASDHREAAYAANQFLMDFLKTRVLLWKKELRTGDGGEWVVATSADQCAAEAWDGDQ